MLDIDRERETGQNLERQPLCSCISHDRSPTHAHSNSLFLFFDNAAQQLARVSLTILTPFSSSFARPRSMNSCSFRNFILAPSTQLDCLVSAAVCVRFLSIEPRDGGHKVSILIIFGNDYIFDAPVCTR